MLKIIRFKDDDVHNDCFGVIVIFFVLFIVSIFFAIKIVCSFLNEVGLL